MHACLLNACVFTWAGGRGGEVDGGVRGGGLGAGGELGGGSSFRSLTWSCSKNTVDSSNLPNKSGFAMGA